MALGQGWNFLLRRLEGIILCEGDRANYMPNKTCHPNPTALVGNWLTDRGNVIEVVKVR